MKLGIHIYPGETVENFSDAQLFALVKNVAEFQENEGPVACVCSEAFYDFLQRTGLDELYQDHVPLIGGDVPALPEGAVVLRPFEANQLDGPLNSLDEGEGNFVDLHLHGLPEYYASLLKRAQEKQQSLRMLM